MIIGVAGTLASGKDTVAEYLEEKGFTHYSTSDVIRDILREEKVEINRDNLVKRANELRTKHGNGVLAKLAVEKCGKAKNKVISAIRNPGEIEYLREQGEKFSMIFVDASIKTRFDRIVNRNKERGEDNYSDFETFKAKEERELKSDNPASQQITKCREMADHIIENNSTFEMFYADIEKIIKEVVS